MHPSNSKNVNGLELHFSSVPSKHVTGWRLHLHLTLLAHYTSSYLTCCHLQLNSSGLLTLRLLISLRTMKNDNLYLKLMSNYYIRLKNKIPTRCHLLFHCISYRLNIFRALLCPSSGARDYGVDYHIGRFVLDLLYVGCQVRLGWSSVWAAALTILQLNRT